MGWCATGYFHHTIPWKKRKGLQQFYRFYIDFANDRPAITDFLRRLYTPMVETGGGVRYDKSVPNDMTKRSN